MSDPSSLRVADADRERLADELREHMVAGRLTQEELEERMARTYEAKTQADLDALRVDLPISPAAVQRSLRERRSHLRRRLAQEAGGSLTASGVCVAIWLAAGAHGQFWPIWVIVFTLLPLVRDGWALLGPAPDERAVEARLQARRTRHLDRERRRARHNERSLPR
ncbi:MAG TPA: DUF1707 domain-containing protein [Solirubrobacteraceae bacterium]|jgi:hypothetical protein|nr:DUF1707 domain-containing protein [Solirubrobacteraceae bacterium]